MLRTPFIVFAGAALLWTLQAQLNHYLSSIQLTVYVAGLLVAFVGLRLGQREGVRALILAGFWFDAAADVPFGLHPFGFIFAQMIIVAVRGRLAREETLVGMVVAALANLFMFAVISVALVHRNPDPLQILARLLADSLASMLVLVIVGPWFFALLEHGLARLGVNLRREQRGLAS